MHLSLLITVFLALFVGTSRAAGHHQCACATANLRLRSGPGTSYGVVSTLTSQRCLPHDGVSQIGGSYTWLRLDFHGQTAWAASNWLNVRTCPNNNNNNNNNNGAQLSGCPRIISRSEWGARAPSRPLGRMPRLPKYVFIHHGDSGACFTENSCKSKARGYQNYHLDIRGWSDIGYSFLVGEDGNAYEARGWSKTGAHTQGYNAVGIAICFIGKFTSHTPNYAALNTAQRLIQCGLDNHKISPSYTLKGHRDVGSSSCPGNALYRLIQGWPHYVSGTGLYSGSPAVVG